MVDCLIGFRTAHDLSRIIPHLLEFVCPNLGPPGALAEIREVVRDVAREVIFSAPAPERQPAFL